MFEFTIFKIPVRVMPWFWITMALLAFLISGGVRNDPTIMVMTMLLFIILAFTSVLLHELGHALTGRHFTGVTPEIVLESFGGHASFSHANFKRWQFISMIAAGPAMNFLLAGIFYLVYHFALPHILTFEKGNLISAFVFFGIWINILWGVFNLLPVFPLDGGQIMHSLMRNQFHAHRVSFVLSIVFIVVGANYGYVIASIFFIFMAMQNYQLMTMHKPR
jgi:Zn-dependent protease